MTLRYVYEQDDIVARFVAHMIPSVGYRGFGRCRTIGIVNDDGQLIAGLVYYNWNTNAGTIHMAGAALPGSRWVTRETLRRMFGYAFDGHACQMAVMHVAPDNEPLLRQLAVAGFTFVTVARLFGRRSDGVVCTLTDNDWASNRLSKKHPPTLVEVHRPKEVAA